jgi:hypothetical protein
MTSAASIKKKIQNESLFASLEEFYSSNVSSGIFEQIADIINRKHYISLRVINWFVTNYCKKNNIVVLVTEDDGTHSSSLNVYTAYQAQLKAYSKELFDPFRRKHRVDLQIDTFDNLNTTTGQLNFFRWFTKNTLMEYIHENFSDIESDMINFTQGTKTSRKPQRKRRCEISEAKYKQISYNHGTLVVNFS